MTRRIAAAVGAVAVLGALLRSWRASELVRAAGDAHFGALAAMRATVAALPDPEPRGIADIAAELVAAVLHRIGVRL